MTLFKNGIRYRKMVHILVAEAFVENTDGKPIVNHKDENKLNNHTNNIMWCTHKENSNWGNCRKKISKRVSKRIAQYSKQGNFIKEWESATRASEILKIDLSSISVSARDFFFFLSAGGYKWRYVNERN